jgi:hypothetical protein
LLLMSLLEEECQRFHIREVPNIKKCFLIRPTASEQCVWKNWVSLALFKETLAEM